MEQEATPQVFWQKFPLDEASEWQLNYAQHKLRIKKGEQRVCIFSDKQEEDAYSLVQTPINEEEADFCRYFTKQNSALTIRPSFPKKPLLVTPEKKNILMPKESIEAYVKIPCNLQLMTDDAKSPQLLTELVSEKLPEAWFGDEHGEACFLLETKLCFEVDEQNPETNVIYCPISLSNTSEELLEMEKFLLHVSYQSIYQMQNGILISDRVSNKFRGKNAETVIQFSKPSEEKFGKLNVLTPSVAPFVDQLMKKSFDLIRSIY